MNDESIDYFNQILLFIIKRYIKKNLSHNLQIYFILHQNHINHLFIIQFYLMKYKYRFEYYLYISEIFNHSTCRIFMLFPNQYRYYNDNIRILLNIISYFAFFSEDYNTHHFKNIF